MNQELKKLTRSVYAISTLVVLAFFGFFWFLSRSFISLRIDPKIALVMIDDTPVRATAAGIARKILTPGEHLIRIEASGYVGYSRAITFKRGLNKEVLVSLKVMPKTTEVAADGRFLSKGADFGDFFYLGSGGKTIYKVKLTLDEKKEIKKVEERPITEARLSGIQEIIWSPNRELALLRKSDGLYLFDFYKYDFVNQRETFWGKDIGSAAWAPDNSKVAYFYNPPGEQSLVFANLSNSESTRVANLTEMGIENPLLRWSPDSEWLFVTPRSKDYSKNKIYLFNAYSRSFKELTEGGSQAEALFSPDCNKILYWTYQKGSEAEPSFVLSVMNKDGSEKRSLDIRADTGKATWMSDSKNIVVALPGESGLLSLVAYNTQSIKESGFALPDVVKSLVSLAVSNDNKILVFESDNKILAIKAEE